MKGDFSNMAKVSQTPAPQRRKLDMKREKSKNKKSDKKKDAKNQKLNNTVID